MNFKQNDFNVKNLGNPSYPSPIHLVPGSQYVEDNERLLYQPKVNINPDKKTKKDPISFELAGPRSELFFNHEDVCAAIVTCGGLCPGLNAVIRALVMQLWHRYHVRNILGIRYGYGGLSMQTSDEPIALDPELVVDIHDRGGSILGTSRGAPPIEELVDGLVQRKINILFCIGGDGTMRGAKAISEKIKEKNLKISVVGIPKTIDNDIPFVRRSFGFESAVTAACEALISAHEEARGAKDGVGLLKLMGRHAGYIAANAAIATGHANFCLIPEVSFGLRGKDGLLTLLDKRLENSGHAVIVVAEGAGQYFFDGQPEDTDASGNKKLGDIGIFLKDQINLFFRNHSKRKISLKYIDPSYIIRSIPPNTTDKLFCTRLAQSAVHAAMAGKTELLIGYWHGEMTHIPLSALSLQKQTITPTGQLWFNVLEATGQPMNIGDAVKEGFTAAST